MGAFQAYHDGSWKSVEILKVCKGRISIQFEHHDCELDEKEVIQSLRLRPRKASPSDCQFFLKPGVDICLLSDCEDMAHSSNKRLQPAWHNVTIISIEKRSHKRRCMCHFWVSYYKDYDPLGKREEKLGTNVIRVSIDNVFIFQRLNTKVLGEDGFALNCIEDCRKVEMSRLFGGIFFSESAWLLVLSISQKLNFEIRVVHTKLVYAILNSDLSNKVISFQSCNGDVKPKIETYVPSISDLVVYRNISNEKMQEKNAPESESSDGSIEFITLRRSKRKKVQPDRYVDIWEEQKKSKFQSHINNDLNVKLEDFDDFFVNKPKNVFKKKDFKCSMMLEAGPCLIIGSYEKEENEIYKEVKLHKLSNNDNVFSRDINFQKKNVSCQDDPFSEIGKINSKNNMKTSSKSMKQSNYSYTSSQPLKETSRAKQLITLIEKIRDELQKEEKTQFAAQHEVNNSEDEQRLPWKFLKSPTHEPVGESLEHADLWKAMENALLAHKPYKSIEDGKNAFSSNTSNETKGQNCPHEYELDEEHGLLCKLCYSIAIERRYVMPPFYKKSYIRIREQCDQDMDIFLDAYNLQSEETNNDNLSTLSDYNNVLSLIPHQMAKKLHAHQKGAFHFLWRHIAGSVNPQELGQESNNLGGCVISHSPGSGKTFLMITFIVSYFKLFPKVRPLIIAPKIVLCVWCKEFKKWGDPFPVYQIGQTYGKGTNSNMMRAISCLEILYKWHQQPSVLLISYSSFFSLTKKLKSSGVTKKVAEFLQKSPGILILDEGHNPRSTASKLRRALMDIKTSHRILLSGTLYQNNLMEYFNTLCLARPSFVFEVVTALNPAAAMNWKNKEYNYHNESKARRIFKEEIAKRIDSTEEEERNHGLDMLGNLTNHFIDVYTSGATDRLPGLESYTILTKSTELQQKILFKLQKLKKNKNNSFELELLITIGSMHPWLVTTFKAIDKYFSAEELNDLENRKYDLEEGSKVKFVINLVQQCLLKGEKVLVFCHYIHPIRFLVSLFENIFKWELGVQVLVLHGDQEVDVRGQLIDKFNDENAVQVMLASTTACAEGISLTAASRVVLLDSEWNPSKTKQAISRVFRPGQEKVVYVYRLLASATFEEEKYEKTVLKERQSQMIFAGCKVKNASDRQIQNIDDDVLRKLVENDMSELLEMILKHGKGCEEML